MYWHQICLPWSPHQQCGHRCQHTEHLRAYGPVWVTEFADTANGSPDAQMDFSTRSAALGFAEVVGRLWKSGIDGVVHFRLSDTYVDQLGGWAGHGLFADWRGTRSQGEPYGIYPRSGSLRTFTTRWAAARSLRRARCLT